MNSRTHSTKVRNYYSVMPAQHVTSLDFKCFVSLSLYENRTRFITRTRSLTQSYGELNVSYFFYCRHMRFNTFRIYTMYVVCFTVVSRTPGDVFPRRRRRAAITFVKNPFKTALEIRLINNKRHFEMHRKNSTRTDHQNVY